MCHRFKAALHIDPEGQILALTSSHHFYGGPWVAAVPAVASCRSASGLFVIIDCDAAYIKGQ